MTPAWGAFPTRMVQETPPGGHKNYVKKDKKEKKEKDSRKEDKESKEEQREKEQKEKEDKQGKKEKKASEGSLLSFAFRKSDLNWDRLNWFHRLGTREVSISGRPLLVVAKGNHRRGSTPCSGHALPRKSQPTPSILRRSGVEPSILGDDKKSEDKEKEESDLPPADTPPGIDWSMELLTNNGNT